MKTKFLLVALWLTSLSVMAQSKHFYTDVPGLTAAQLSAKYWQGKLSAPDERVMTPAQIDQFNQDLKSNNPYINDILSLPDALSAERVKSLINGASSRPDTPRFKEDGKPLTDAEWQALLESRAIESLSENVKVQFGLITTRTDLRTFPTTLAVYKDDLDHDLDRFQETALFPGDEIAVLHRSQDEKWYFVLAFHYAGWVPADAIGLGTRAQVAQFVSAESRLVVTGARVQTNYVPGAPARSRTSLDMGVSLPLLTPKEPVLNGQNVSFSYLVALPVRDKNGNLRLENTLIGRGEDVHEGSLPYTRSNIISQAFKFLGERYGWGGRYHARDCTGFVSAVYRTVGLRMPRNSSQQGESAYGINWQPQGSREEINRELAAKLMPGDLLYLPGHVMMSLGNIEGKPWVIHDVKGFSYTEENGNYYRSALNGVSVTPLLPLQLSQKTFYTETLYQIKRLGVALEDH